VSQRLNQRMSCVATADFFNRIGHNPTSAQFNFLKAAPSRDPSTRLARLSTADA
jgi:hypothetical protein